MSLLAPVQPPSQDRIAIIDASTSHYASSTQSIQSRSTTASDNTPSIPIRGQNSAPGSACDAAMKDQDILPHIFNHFVPTPYPPQVEDRKFLLELALQCSSFSEPALDCLWMHLCSLVPLVRLLPSATISDENKYYLSGSTLELSLAFKKHAARVRVLHIVDDNPAGDATYEIDSSVYVLFAQFLGGDPLLPGLTTLHFKSTTHAPWNALPTIVPCGSLTAISLGSDILLDARALHLFFPLLASRAASLESITVCLDRQVDPTLVVSAIGPLRRIKTLAFKTHWPQSFAPPQMLSELGKTFRHLQRLEFVVRLHPDLALPNGAAAGSSSFGGGPAVPEVIDEYLFPSLRYLSLVLNGHHPDFMLRYNIPSLIHNVTNLDLTLQSWPTWGRPMSDLIKSLSGYLRLRVLSLRQAQCKLGITVNDIAILLAKLNLDELHLRLWVLRPMRRTSFERSAQSCFCGILAAAGGLKGDTPSRPLRSLTLPGDWENGDGALTLLIEVARKTPDLQYISMPVDSSLTFSKLSNLTSLISTPNIPRSSALKVLVIHDDRTGNYPFTPPEYRTIARYIDTCFPNLMSMSAGGTSNSITLAHWEFIEQLRVMFQENRRLSAALVGSRGF